MGGGGSPPQAPNPAQVSQQQTQSNVQTAIANATLGNTNQVTPTGSLKYDVTGGTHTADGTFIPSYTATQTLSPEQQAIYDKTTGLQTQALGLGPKVLQNVGDTINTPLPDVGKLRDDAYNALTARSTQALDRQETAQKAQLANQGIEAGSTAYDNALRPIEQGRVDASNQGVIGAGNVAGQNLAQAQQIHNQPLSDYSALLGFGGGVQSPTYAPASAGTVAPTDVSGNAWNAYNGQLQQYQQGQSQSNALMGGLFGLGGSVLGGLAGSFAGPGGAMLGSSLGGQLAGRIGGR